MKFVDYPNSHSVLTTVSSIIPSSPPLFPKSTDMRCYIFLQTYCVLILKKCKSGREKLIPPRCLLFFCFLCGIQTFLKPFFPIFIFFPMCWLLLFYPMFVRVGCLREYFIEYNMKNAQIDDKFLFFIINTYVVV